MTACPSFLPEQRFLLVTHLGLQHHPARPMRNGSLAHDTFLKTDAIPFLLLPMRPNQPDIL